jgi:hypothetical protein
MLEGLHHVEIERVETDAAGCEFEPDIAIAEKHAPRLLRRARRSRSRTTGADRLGRNTRLAAGR